MKKLMTFIVFGLFSTVTFSQDTKIEKNPDMKPPMKMSHECYMMKDGALMHCTVDKAEAQKTSVKLKGGTLISPKGEVKMKDGQTMKLTDGQCMSLMGSVGDCEKMHAGMNTIQSPEPIK